MHNLIPLIPYIAVAIGMYCLRSAWVALGMYHAGMLAVVCLSKPRHQVSTKRRIRAIWMPAIALVFTIGGALLYILWPYLNSDSAIIAEKLAYYGIEQHTWPWFAAYFCTVNSTLEELFWRGSLGSDNPRPVANDFLFGGYHVFVLLAFTQPVWALPVLICTAFAGWLWRMLRRLTGGLAVPMVTHVVADVCIVVAVQLRVFG